MAADPVLGHCRVHDVLYVRAADDDGRPTDVVRIGPADEEIDAPAREETAMLADRVDMVAMLAAAHCIVSKQLRAAEALPRVDQAGSVVLLRIPDAKDFSCMTGKQIAALDAIEDLAERDKAYELADMATCWRLKKPGLELWIVDPSGANAVEEAPDAE